MIVYGSFLARVAALLSAVAHEVNRSALRSQPYSRCAVLGWLAGWLAAAAATLRRNAYYYRQLTQAVYGFARATPGGPCLAAAASVLRSRVRVGI